MSVRANYSDSEWQTIATVPSLIGAAMSAAGNSGVMGTMKEALANVRSIMEGNKDQPDNPVINEIVIKPDEVEEAKAKAAEFKAAVQQKMKDNNIQTPEELKSFALSATCDALDLINAKETEATVEGYKQWVYAIAKRVAEAAKEGGFLGFGGTQVSDPEAQMLSELQDKLGLLSV